MAQKDYYVLIIDDDKRAREAESIVLYWELFGINANEESDPNKHTKPRDLNEHVEIVDFPTADEAYDALFPEQGKATIDPEKVLFVLVDLYLPRKKFENGIHFIQELTGQYSENPPRMGLISVDTRGNIPELGSLGNVSFYNKDTAQSLARYPSDIRKTVEEELQRRENSPEGKLPLA